ncbi:hypothetical protein AVEN_121875-1 [Araneus ventricosus]|uniref:Uncharacterized protein n=1 Tax=Araneus ventricosus TaxID=182803 RepID=A0A4Y2UML1_ARAVE|nr:hypothetical protein AVEN_215912-1 [Araneus ventricosus]GBO14235.1 hypothetical protein AVEN_229341-1 [Araneus ventricosus]GBO14240.1 hypothetical protein AVEN_247458-1 [Araneus ventricosus]GBO14269.1 hypothetical protein AVEN_121875-1 [Araneus ventricosus]
MRAILDGPRNFEPQSDDYDAWAGSPIFSLPLHAGRGTLGPLRIVGGQRTHYMADLQSNLASSLELRFPNAETLTLGHRGLIQSVR